MTENTAPPLLKVDNLSVAFGDNTVVENISFQITKGDTLALVGESGSGKSVTAMAILRLLPSLSRYTSGTIDLDGLNMLSANDKALQAVRGGRVGVIFQEPMSALNPLHTIGRQISETLSLHRRLGAKETADRVKELLHQVELEALVTRLDAYPHELSGGQRQRVMIAMAIANNPDLLIADEPTTALDVTVQAEILKLLKKLQSEYGMAMLFISHDLGVVRHIAHHVAIMKAGRIIEQGEATKVFESPVEDYTKALLGAAPTGEAIPLPAKHTQLISTANLTVRFPAARNFFGKVTDYYRAVDDVSLTLQTGETLGIVGESGSGKTTLGLALLRLLSSSGEISYHEIRLDQLNLEAMRPHRREMQIVFQDPYASLNPRMTIGQIIGEGLDVHGVPEGNGNQRQAIVRILEEVGLKAEHRYRYPHEFSGGQRQRINIARALVLQPKLVIFDEPTSALDLITQSQILSLLKEMQRKHGLTYIFISHDLRVVRAISHRILVLKNGKQVETDTTNELFTNPKTDYTKQLIASAML